MPSALLAVLSTPLPAGWRIALHGDEQALHAAELVPPSTALQPPATPFGMAAAAAIDHFFAGTPIDLPLAPSGTPYQQRVWQALLAIPRGSTRQYGEIAAELASGARAVAAACRANPIVLLIPCHRVVASSGIGGYMGRTAAIDLKSWLLAHEHNP